MSEDTLIPQNTLIDYSEADIMIEDIIKMTESYLHTSDPDAIRDTIMRTYIFAREAHADQRRKSGEPYITHPLSATKILLSLKPDLVSIQSCILHDVIEDTPRTEDDIRENFGEDVATICQGLTKFSTIKYRGEERSIESLRKMLLAMIDDMRVIIVKLADRIHNMQTLDFHPDPKKRERIALETLNIYAPIADRLGIFRFKEALETECFRILYPSDFLSISTALQKLGSEQEFFLTESKRIIRDVINESAPIVDISYRIKSPYSIYKKLKRKGNEYTDIHDLYDLFAIRIITDSVSHCYEILGIIHNAFTPKPKRFKDYIALPKENGYQSLHTTVVEFFPKLRLQPTEIQIRTVDMHRQAEIGVAAHFAYSETGESHAAQDSYWVQTIKHIVDENKEGFDFMSDMKVNIFKDQVFIFTPKGDVITLPRGSTPIDFAYAIHSNIGDTFSIAKVDGRIVSLDYHLRSGESVTIVTDKNHRPKPIWLSFVVTSKARDHIRAYINQEEREFFIDKGRSILNSYLEKYYGKGLTKDLSMLRMMNGAALDTKQKEDVLVQIGNLSRKPGSVLKAIHDDVIREMLGERIIDISPEKSLKKSRKKEKDQKQEEEQNLENITVIIGKERDIPYKIAGCCHPTPEDHKIIGVIGQGIVTIHRFDCVEIEKVELRRRIPAKWSHMPEIDNSLNFGIEITFHDERGILMQLTQIFYQLGLDIQSFSTEKKNNNIIIDRFTFKTGNDDDYYIYDRLEARLRFELEGIIEDIRRIE